MEPLVYSYALFVDNEFACVFYFPATGDDYTDRTTAALQSNPTITLDADSDIPNTYKYSVHVEGEYVGPLYLLKEIERYPVERTNAALQSNPKVVWIDTDTLVASESKWKLEGTKAVPDGE
jgi:hypothetical protein